MKVYISVDMEGVSGVVHNEHTSERGYDYQLARHLMMGETNAAVEGAVNGGARQVLVSDSHGGNGARNLLIHDLHPAADLVSGFPRPLGQLAALVDDFDVVLLVGYHTMDRAAGVLNHTVHGLVVSRLIVDGRELGEVGINALLAGQVGVPIGLVSGDDKTIEEALDLLPDIETAIVKWAINRYSARCMAPERAQTTIKAAAERAVRRASTLKPFDPGHPARWELRFKDSGMAEVADQIPAVSMLADDTVYFDAPNASEGFQMLTTAISVASGVLLK